MDRDTELFLFISSSFLGSFNASMHEYFYCVPMFSEISRMSVEYWKHAANITAPLSHQITKCILEEEKIKVIED